MVPLDNHEVDPIVRRLEARGMRVRATSLVIAARKITGDTFASCSSVQKEKGAGGESL